MGLLVYGDRTLITCERCGYQWSVQGDSLPERCPPRNGCGNYNYLETPFKRRRVMARPTQEETCGVVVAPEPYEAALAARGYGYG